MEAPVPEMKQVAGITVSGEEIVVHCRDKTAVLKLDTYIDAANTGNPELLLQWVIFWQLLSLNQHVKTSADQATEAMQNHDPAELIKGVMAQVAGLGKQGE